MAHDVLRAGVGSRRWRPPRFPAPSVFIPAIGTEVNPGRPNQRVKMKNPEPTSDPWRVRATGAANFGAIGEIPARQEHGKWENGKWRRRRAVGDQRHDVEPRVSRQAAPRRPAAEGSRDRPARKFQVADTRVRNFRAGCRFSIPLGPPAAEMERCCRKLGKAEDRDRRDVPGCGRPYDTTRPRPRPAWPRRVRPGATGRAGQTSSPSKLVCRRLLCRVTPHPRSRVSEWMQRCACLGSRYGTSRTMRSPGDSDPGRFRRRCIADSSRTCCTISHFGSIDSAMIA